MSNTTNQTSNSFLPADYEIPKNDASENYLNPAKIKEGETVRFRILSKAIMGWQYWTIDKKPVMLPLDKAPKDRPSDAQLKDGKFKMSHFWAMVVWNYNKEMLQIFEVTQKTIMESMKTYFEDSQDFGDPFNYDFKISRTGEALETKYSVMATAIKELGPEIKEKIIEGGIEDIKLEKLFDGEDPFEKMSK